MERNRDKKGVFMWKDIKNYEGHYQINEYGDVRSIKFSREKIISSYVTCNGYCQVTLIKNGKKRLSMCTDL